MASVVTISGVAKTAQVREGEVLYLELGTTRALPQVVWSDGRPWREANLWLFERDILELSFQTLRDNAKHLSAFASWLEKTNTKWHHFPVAREQRCLDRYRADLVRKRNDREIAASTATHRMRLLIAFYRWAKDMDLVSQDRQMWSDRELGIKVESIFGLQRTLKVASTSLAIPNRRVIKPRLEDGVLPVSLEKRDLILKHAFENCPLELYLILLCGFFTGMRLSTICDLRIATLANAFEHASNASAWLMSVGPGAVPPVHTKFGVTGNILIPKSLLDELFVYSESPVRRQRARLAANADRDLLFFTRTGRSYSAPESGRSNSINVLVQRLRDSACERGLNFKGFKFHQTRATFATCVADAALKAGLRSNAIALVKDLLLHANESTSLQYIKFLEEKNVKETAADAFAELLLSLRGAT